jgi:hypothetical protein
MFVEVNVGVLSDAATASPRTPAVTPALVFAFHDWAPVIDTFREMARIGLTVPAFVRITVLSS